VRRSVLLLIEDAAARDELTAVLAQLGHAVADASDGARDVDIVILTETTGFEDTVDGLGLPVLFVASELSEDVLRASTAHGSAGVVLRPLAPRELHAAIETAVYRARGDKKAAIRERWYQTTLRSIGDAVITADEESAITFINPTAQALTGWSEAEALGQPLDSVFCVENDEQPEASASGEPGAPLLRLRRRDATSCTIEHNAAPIVEGNGALHGVVVVFRDITEKRRIEQRLALSGRMTSIGTLAAGIAHELNNPLAFVTSNLDFVIGELATMKDAPTAAPDPIVVEDSLSALREAADGAARAAQIVKDMKVFIRGEADPKISVDVNRALSFAARLTNSEVRHVGELEMNLEDVPPTLADEGKLVQVFVNLLTNAAQAIDAKKEERKIRVSTTLEGDRVVVRIADTGRGIAPEHLGRVFEPFFTTKPVGQGLGLGLSISHTIVSAFGGTITLDSEPGRGTSVMVSLPVGDERRRSSASQDVAAQPRVLVVDDEALIGTAVRRILVKQGFDVMVENDSKKAFESIVRGERFDVVVCDLMMPGFSGVDFYEGLAKTAPAMQSRVLLMTGNAFTPRARELFESTKNVRLEKPFLPADLVSAVTEVLRRHGE
jgi:PAS domain S-box-containing protein